MARRFAIRAAAFATLAAALSASSCTNSNQQGNSSAESSPAVATPTPPPPTPNPDQFTGLIARFYRDLDKADKASMADIASMATAHFLLAHKATWARDYGFMTHIRLQPGDVRGSAADYA